jgi:hypothetical protein
MKGPYATGALSFYAISALSLAFIGAYRAGLYQLPASAWALALGLGVLGLLAPLAMSAPARGRVLAGSRPLIVIVPIVALVLTPRVLPSPFTVGPFFFCAGVLFATSTIGFWNISQRRRALRRRLVETMTQSDEGVRAWLQEQFASNKGEQKASSKRSRALLRALRAQAWISTRKRRARAAAMLRKEAAALDEAPQSEPAVPLPSEALVALVLACAESPGRLRAAYLRAAEHLESGGRMVRWRSWLGSVWLPELDAYRDVTAAVDSLAVRYRVKPPRWFRATCRKFSCSAVTARDVEPPWNRAGRGAKPVTAAVAVIVVASATLSTATAQAPLDDARALPIRTGAGLESHVEPLFSRVASRIARHRAEVRCWSRHDWQRLSAQRTSWPRRGRRLGRWSAYASLDHKRAHLSPALCTALTRLAYGRVPVERDYWPAALSFSVATLAHESQHLKGISNEAKAECYGMQTITFTAQALGRTKEEGRYLAYLYWRDEYHDHRDPAYISAECRDGGGLDLRPRSDLWP